VSARPTPLHLRFLGLAMAVVLLFGALLLVTRRNADDRVEPTGQGASTDGGARDGESPGGTASSPPPVPLDDDQPPLDAAAAMVLLTDVAAAQDAGAALLVEAAALLADTTWGGLDRVASDDVRSRPVYVVDAVVAPDRRHVDATVLIAVAPPGSADASMVLRFLPGASAVTDAGSVPDVRVTVDGLPVDHVLDGDGARLVVTSDRLADTDGPPLLLRVEVGYDVPDRRTIVDDGGPAGFGLLAWNPDMTMLGHFVPLLTFEDGAMIPWGDVGSFPVAAWSVVLDHPGVAVTGGAETDCPQPRDGCVWARGLTLRDLAIAVYDDAVTVSEDDGVRAIGSSRSLSASTADTIVAESLAARDVLTDLFGALPWPDIDVVLAPLTSGAAGMEFPGLYILRTDTAGSLGGGFGTYVAAHEVAHQWFHAYLGNGSLGSPVVDESLAQYASYLFFADEYGEGAASNLATRYYGDRYRGWRQSGGKDVAPAASLADFGSNDVYGPMVYARGALAWIAAEQAIGRDVVVGFVRSLVADHGLSEVDVTAVVQAADLWSMDLADVLRRWWIDPTPIPLEDVP